MDYTELFYPARFAVGPGSVAALTEFAQNRELKRGLIVTDRTLRGLPLMERVTAALDGAGVRYEFFDGVIANPSAETADAAAAAFAALNADFIVAVGGGSAADTAKAASLVAANGGSARHYIGVNRSLRPGAPVAAVSTTAGTGAEVTRFFVLTDVDRRGKAIGVDDHCLVALAVSDPLLMTELPADITAATAMDALTHAMEAYCAVTANPFTDGLALKAVGLIDKALPRVMKDPADVAARTDLCWAASLAGYAFSNSGLGLMHSLGFSIENFTGVPHGQAVGMVMPYVLEFNRRAIGERVADLGGVCGLSDHVTLGVRTVRHMSDRLSALPIPTLRETGFAVGDIPALAEMALNDPTLAANPVQPSREELTALIESVYCEELK